METASLPLSVRARRRFLALRWIGLFLACAAVCGVRRAAAQVQLEISLARRTYMLYEPLVATVTLTNQAGRDLVFEDLPGKQWFNVEIATLDGQVIQPYDPDYKLNPLTVPAGQTVKRKIDLNPLFPVREQGTHRMRANVYLADNDRFYASSFVTFDIAEGQLMWRQDVGVPGSNDTRQMSLLTFQRPDRLMLYARVRDGENGTNMYTTQPLGRILSSGAVPQVLLDRDNTLHVLQEAMPSAFLYTEISIDGTRLDQKAYDKVGANRPKLEKFASGDVAVQGGRLQAASAKGVASAPVREPKLSDRPSELPGNRKSNGQLAPQ